MAVSRIHQTLTRSFDAARVSGRVALVFVCSAVAKEAHAARDTELAYLAFSDGYWQVWVSESDGSHARQVTRSTYDKTRVSWFPSGEELLVNGNDGIVSRVLVGDGRVTTIRLEQHPVLDAVVSPDGVRIAFSFSTAIDGNDIWIAGVDGSDVAKVVKMSALQHEPAWSSAGDALYFLSGDGGQAHDIWRVGLVDQRTEQITVASLYNFDVAVSASGDLAFSSNRSGNYEIYVQRQAQPPEKLTDDPALDARPSFAPDGESLVFESSRGGRMNVWRVDVATGRVAQITKHRDGARSPQWRPAGSTQ